MPLPKSKEDSNEIAYPNILNRQIVSCPMMSKFETFVDVAYCTNKCNFYGNVVQNDTNTSPGQMICNFPRKLTIYPIAG